MGTTWQSGRALAEGRNGCPCTCHGANGPVTTDCPSYRAVSSPLLNPTPPPPLSLSLSLPLSLSLSMPKGPSFNCAPRPAAPAPAAPPCARAGRR
jgi:hypothetical protein